jgi:hypothetical protein
MRKPIFVLAFSLAAAAALPALPTDITFTDGDASVRYVNGRAAEAVIGDVLDTGDSLKTGSDGLVEMNQKGLVLKISPDTVFTLRERERGGEKTGVLSVVLGSLKMRFDKLTGKEPLVQTASCAAAARGTELTVYAGADGSSLIAVDSGQVQVEAMGTVVDVNAGEGVEVKPGQAPGDIFDVRTQLTDFRTWNDGKLAAMAAEPTLAIRAVTGQMLSYIKSVDEFQSYYQEYSKRLAEERQKAIDMVDEKGKEETRTYEEAVVFPLALQTGNLYLNMRFYSLAALSLRRYVAGRMYLIMKTRYLTHPEDPAFGEFLDRYHEFLSTFERFIVPHLVEADL